MPVTSLLPSAIVLPFAVTYEGNDADQHIISAQQLGESIIGASRLYNAVAHYCAFGFVPKGNYKNEFYCYAKVPKEGSYEYMLYVAAIAQEYNLHGEIYNAAISWLFARVVDSVKGIWTRKGDTVQVVEILSQTLIEQARIDADVKTQMINAWAKSNDNLASLHARLIDTLPQLADATRSHGRLLVSPIGNTCRSINQFSGTKNAVAIDEPEAEVIRGDYEMEVDDMQDFNCRRITEVNVETGHCILDVEGFDHPITGKISDPALSMPNNVYTRALNGKTAFLISAKPVKRDGVVHKLFVSNAK